MPKAHRPASSEPIHLSPTTSPVVMTPEDCDRFVMTQREVIEACNGQLTRVATERKVRDDINATVTDVIQWARDRNDVHSCFIAPRMDDLLIAVVAKDEDEGGALHDAMCELDLRIFQRNRLRFYWLLLRRTEAEGLDAFSDKESRVQIFRAD